MKKLIILFLPLMLAVSEAKVVSVIGKAEVNENGEWRELVNGNYLDEGAIISTGFNSTAILEIEGNMVKLEPLTRMSIEQVMKKEIVQNGKNKVVTKTAVFIDTGKASFKVNSTERKLNDFKVYSPTATASVRGTEYTVDSNSGTISTSHGLVAGSSGTDRNKINREKIYIRPEGEVSVFTSVKDVGGSDGAIPVAAGETITFSSVNGERTTPFSIRKKNSVELPDSTAGLSEGNKIEIEQKHEIERVGKKGGVGNINLEF